MQTPYLTDKDRRGKIGAVGAVVAFLLFVRFASIAMGIRRGILAAMLSIGLLLLLIWAVTRWQNNSSRGSAS